MRALLLALVVVSAVLAPAGRAHAAPPPKAAPAAPATPPVALTAQQARAAIAVLQDPAKRAELIAALEAIAALPQATGTPATPAAAPASAAAPKPEAASALPIPLAPDSLGAQLLLDASAQMTQISKGVFSSVRALTDFPLLWFWVRQTATDPFARAEILVALLSIVEVLLPGLVVAWLVRRALRRVMAALDARAPAPPLADAIRDDEVSRSIEEAEAGQTERQWSAAAPWLLALRRLPFAAAGFGLQLLPIVALLATGAGILTLHIFDAAYVNRVVVIAAFNATALFLVLLALAGFAASTSYPRLRLLPLDDAGALELWRWTRTLGALAIFGYAALEAGLVFGLYAVVHDALFKLLALAIVLCLCTIALRHKVPVARWIRGQMEAEPGQRQGRAALVSLRHRAASFWHILVVFYLLALWAVWALAITGGFRRMVRVFILSVIILIAARLVQRIALRAVVRAMRVRPEIAERFPGLEQRLGAYHPILRGIVKVFIAVIALVLLAQVWGFDAIQWFSGRGLGAQLLASIGNTLVACVIALAIWEGVNAAVAGHLRKLSAHEQVARAARIRTLLPLLRTTLFIAILVIVALIVLSEIGVNIAPLLAGAGVVGIAVGFGSQKLVQDIITGLFLLLENAMQVGDAVTLAGLSGAVETLSIRTIRLRAGDGSMHIIPFSAVTSVTNMTRDFGYAVMTFRAGLNEEPDRIADILREVAAGMRKESGWTGIILGDLEIIGVDKFLVGAWVMMAQIRTTPGSRWSVAREMNRRVKYRFDELAIDSPITSYKARGIEPPTIVSVPDPSSS